MGSSKTKIAAIFSAIIFLALSAVLSAVYLTVDIIQNFVVRINDYKFNQLFIVAVVFFLLMIMLFISISISFFIFDSANFKKFNAKTVFMLTAAAVVISFIIGFTLSNFSSWVRYVSFDARSIGTSHSEYQINSSYNKNIFFLNYLGNKEMTVSSNINKYNDITFVVLMDSTINQTYREITEDELNRFELHVSNDLKYFDEDSIDLISDDALSYVFEGDKYTFMFDSTYYDTNDLVFIASDTYRNSYYIMSAELYSTLPLSDSAVANYELHDFTDEVPSSVTNPFYTAHPSFYPIQFLILLSMLIIGFMITALFKNGRISALDVVLSFIVGIATQVVYSFFLLVTGIPLNEVSYITGFIAIFIVSAVKIRQKIQNKTIIIDYKGVIISALAILFVALFFIIKDRIFFSYDSLQGISLGQILNITDGNINSYELQKLQAYGFLSALFSVIGFTFGGGALYAIYPLSYVIITVLITGLIYNYAKKVVPNYAPAISVVALLSVFFISEFQQYYLWALNNIIVAALFLSVIHILVNTKVHSTLYDYVFITAISVVIMISRVEGAIYLALILASSLLLNIDKKDVIKLSSTILAINILYNIWLMIVIGVGNDTVFFSLTNSLLSILALAAVVLAAAILIVIEDKLPIVNKYLIYFFLAAIAITFLGAALLADYDSVKSNLQVLLYHITEPTTMMFWALFVAFVISLFFDEKLHSEKENSFTLFLVVGYVILTVCIFFFRIVDGVALPMKVAPSDSGRRILFQMMPFAIYLFARVSVRRLKNYLPKASNDLNLKSD